MYPLIDTHAHLDEIEGLDGVLAQARAAGVVAVIALGSDRASNEKVLEIAARYSDLVYPALGLHPFSLKVAEIDAELDYLRTNITRAVAVGEVGLDYHKRALENNGKDFQRSVLREVLKIARMHGKPALIHARYAWRDALSLVQAAGLEKAVFHWFAGPSSVLRDIIAAGYYISVIPGAAYIEEHRRAIKEVPLERLLLETDSPVIYGRGTPDEFQATPADVLRSLKAAAESRNISELALAEATARNARGLFSLPVQA